MIIDLVFLIQRIAVEEFLFSNADFQLWFLQFKLVCGNTTVTRCHIVHLLLSCEQRSHKRKLYQRTLHEMDKINFGHLLLYIPYERFCCVYSGVKCQLHNLLCFHSLCNTQSANLQYMSNVATSELYFWSIIKLQLFITNCFCHSSLTTKTKDLLQCDDPFLW